MMEFLVLALLIYVGLKAAWWLVKATLFIGIAALLIGALFTPWIFVF